MKIFLVQLPTSHHGSGEKVYPLGLSRLSSLVPAEYTKNALCRSFGIDPEIGFLMFVPDSTLSDLAENASLQRGKVSFLCLGDSYALILIDILCALQHIETHIRIMFHADDLSHAG